MKLLQAMNPEHASEIEVNNFSLREAARAVVMDESKNVALLYVAKDNSYKLPGGGLEEGETAEQALHRECLEEIGCQIEILQEIGMIVEMRKFYTLKQTSYCYLAKLKGKKGKPNFAADEIADGFKELWVPFEQAIRLISENKSMSVEGKLYIVPRDLFILQIVKNFFINS